MFTGRKKGKSELVLFVLDSSQTGFNGFFCSGRYQPEKRRILIGPVCIRFFRKQDLLEFSFFPAGGFSLPYPDQRTKGWPPYGAQPFVCGIHSISATDWKSATPRTPNFFDNSLKKMFFWAENPRIFLAIFRRSFCEG